MSMKTSPFFVKRNYLLLAILISGTASASSVVPFSVSENLAAPLEVVAEQTQNSLHQQTVKTFLKDFYEKYLFVTQVSDMSFEKAVQTYCTKSLQAYLEEQYENECPNGDCYERSCFLSGLQDGPSDESKLIKIIPKEDDWYLVLYYDMGNKDRTYIHCVLENGVLKMDRISRSYEDVKKGPDYSGTYTFEDESGFQWKLTLNKDESAQLVVQNTTFYCSWSPLSSKQGPSISFLVENRPVICFKAGRKAIVNLEIVDGYVYPMFFSRTKDPNWRIPVEKIK